MATAGRILMIPKGEYNADTSYEMLDVVSYNGSAWVAKRAVVGIEPNKKNAEYWQNLVSAHNALSGMIVDNLDAEVKGLLLDASQGKILDEKIAEANHSAANEAKVLDEKITETNNSVASNASAIGKLSDDVTSLEEEITVERNRINNIAKLKGGSTTGDAELTDIRVGADGNTYSSAGEAVRTQFSNLADALETHNEHFNNGLVYLHASVNTDGTPENYGKKYIFGEKGCTLVRFHAQPNTKYKIKVIGQHDRFRFYGRIEKDTFKEIDNTATRIHMDGIIADNSTDEIIDSVNEYTINSGEYYSVYVYLSSKSALPPTISVEVAEPEKESFMHGLILFNASMNTSSATGYENLKYILPESGCTVVRFNTQKNTNYKIKAIGKHDRFRFYGRKDKDSFDYIGDYAASNRIYMDGIIADKSNVPNIDEMNEYVINSGDYQSVYVYLSSDKTLSPTISVEIVEGATYKNIFKPWLPPTEEDMTVWQAYTYQELIDNVYEPLRAKYPTYISRSVIGKDSTNTYDIYQYTFEPDYYEQTCYLQSGVHPREEDGWVGLAKLIQHICEDWSTNEQLSYLRWGVKMIVVPVVNVWGVSQPVSARSDYNVNGVNLNRDTQDKTQAETQVVTAFIDSIYKQLSFAIDYHTTVNDTYGDYMLTAWTGEKNEHIAKRTLYMLARKNAPERLNSYLDKYGLETNELRLPNVGDSANTGTYVWYFKSKGVAGATVEHSDYVWDTSKCTSKTVAKAVECFGNHLIQHAENKLSSLE